MTNNTYGINSENSGYTDASNTLLGAKNYATRNGYNQVFIRFNGGYEVELAADKSMGYWIDAKNFEKFFDNFDLDCGIYFAKNTVLSGEFNVKELLNEYEYKEEANK